MHLLRLIRAVTFFVLSSALGSAHADSFVYQIANHFSSFQVDGTITTDTNAGVLSYSDITDFNFLITVGAASDTLTPATTDNNGLYGYGLTATSTGLFFDYDQPFALLFFNNMSTGTALCFQTQGCDTSMTPSELVQVANSGVVTEAQTGNVQIGAIVETAVTPEPSPFVLLLTGAGAAVAFGRFRTSAV